jgi:hypothetical protein
MPVYPGLHLKIISCLFMSLWICLNTYCEVSGASFWAHYIAAVLFAHMVIGSLGKSLIASCNPLRAPIALASNITLMRCILAYPVATSLWPSYITYPYPLPFSMAEPSENTVMFHRALSSNQALNPSVATSLLFLLIGVSLETVLYLGEYKMSRGISGSSMAARCKFVRCHLARPAARLRAMGFGVARTASG